jgi:plastocyanin
MKNCSFLLLVFVLLTTGVMADGTEDMPDMSGMPSLYVPAVEMAVFPFSALRKADAGNRTKSFAGKGTGIPRPAATFNVTVAPDGSLSFSPDSISIHVGDTVTWTWGGSGHSVVSGNCPENICTADNAFCSPSNTNCASAPSSSSGATYSRVFNSPGTFNYFCRPHGPFGMTGSVVVLPASPASVSVSGGVFTAEGRAVSKASVYLTNSVGDKRVAVTSPFGYYKFDGVAVGETYGFTVVSKQYQFAPQQVMVTDEIGNLNFIAQP